MRGVNAKCRWEKNKIGCCCKRPFATQVSVANRLKRCYLRRIPFALMLVVMMTRMSRMSMAVMMMSMHFPPDCTTKRLEKYQVSRKPFPFKMRRRGSSPPKVTIWHLLKLSSDLVNGPQSEQTLKLRIQFKLNTALLSYCPCVRVSVRVSQAWHLTFLTYIKA